MKKYMLLLALIAATSVIAMLINQTGVSDDKSEDISDDPMLNYLGV